MGDCLEVMKTFPDNHFSAIVTDPPYGLHFMGKDWDKFNRRNFNEEGKHHRVENSGVHHDTRDVRSIASANAHSGTYDESRNDEFQYFMQQVATQALRITKPGGHCLMFGAPRRFHRQICALEDAGWEIRDCLMWIFGSGFPKSHNHFGIEGYGTALKPAYEPIIMAMKPLDGTFKQNAEKWGQAGINIAATRIGNDLIPNSNNHTSHQKWKEQDGRQPKQIPKGELTWSKGRWPANVLFDEEAAQMLDEQSGFSHSKAAIRRNRSVLGVNTKDDSTTLGMGDVFGGFNDSGGASRFFYVAKTSSRERNEGLEGLPIKSSAGCYGEFEGDGRGRQTEHRPQKNNHPTVKPLALMRYLITLVAPPTNALILDPFAGSGSTILAAKQLGISAIGIEKSEEYVKIAEMRVANTPIQNDTNQLALDI